MISVGPPTELTLAALLNHQGSFALGDGGVSKWDDPTIGTQAHVTFSFATARPRSPPPFTDLSTFDGFNPFTLEQRQATRDILAGVSMFADITFTEVADDTGSIVLFNDSALGPFGGATHFPFPGSDGESYLSDGFFGNVTINSSVAGYTSPTPGELSYWTLVHEIGHALGLKHVGPGDGDLGPFLPPEENNSDFTIMALPQGPSGERPTEFQVRDIQALQYLYGVPVLPTELAGSPFNDEILGTGSDDVLKGYEGDDIFVFAPGGGDDTVGDFADGDLVRFVGTELRAFSDVLARATYDATGAVIDYGAGTVTLNFIAPGQFGAGDFVFT